MRPTFTTTPSSYTGPVPIVTHVHGAFVSDESDGYAEAWYLPAARNIPAGYFTEGSFYDHFKEKFRHKYGVEWTPGSAMYQYPNHQRAGTFWYHDHTLGLTRVNVFAGPAGFYILRGGPGDDVDGVLPGPAPALGDPLGTRYYEIPLAIQDRAFNPDGSLHYPDSRADFDDFPGPYIPFSDISPIWNPEVFGNVMVVNGRTWPRLAVEPRRYRFRVLNGCNSRFLILKLASDPLAPRPVTPVLPFWQIGAEGGYLPAAVELPQLLMGPAERADVIVDFTGLPAGTELFLINEAPDEPYGGGIPGTDFEPADPEAAGQVMKLIVVPLGRPDPTTPADQLGLPEREVLGPEIRTRQVSLNEEDSEVLPDVGPREALLGIVDDMGMAMPMMWSDLITENPGVGDTEIWEIHNHTMDAHPIHIHEIMFEVVNREPLHSGEVRDPEPWETGLKDTVIAYPHEMTRVKARFDLPGLYVWHCHIVEHEDNEMMRPYYVGRLNNTWLPNVPLG
jgi:bilirubin oxidase